LQDETEEYLLSGPHLISECFLRNMWQISLSGWKCLR